MDAEKLQQPITALRVREPLKVSSNTPVRNVIERLKEKGAGCVLIVGDDDELLGIFTERDALKKLFPLGNAALDQPVSAVMTTRPTVLHLDDSIVYALHQMHVGGYRHIPLLDEQGKPSRIVSVRAVVDYLAARLDSKEKG